MEKSCRRCAPKASPRTLFNFGKQPKTAIACKKFFQKLDILKEHYQRDKVIENKRSLDLVTSCSSGYKTSPEKCLY